MYLTLVSEEHYFCTQNVRKTKIHSVRMCKYMCRCVSVRASVRPSIRPCVRAYVRARVVRYTGVTARA